jgi:hypothetical protein
MRDRVKSAIQSKGSIEAAWFCGLKEKSKERKETARYFAF